ncbi:putative glutathione S-transferase 6 [Aphelenchoides besseyi]|nr:putative glutathione S-transferase 6 [Aphelenchoides besseyi]KAI6216491.1 putative glutathione S-transferase 6 [Aphelenchoides besseyi]
MFWFRVAVLFVLFLQVESECRDKLGACYRAKRLCMSANLMATLKENCRRTCGYCTNKKSKDSKNKNSNKNSNKNTNKKGSKKKDSKKKDSKKKRLPKFKLHYFDYRFRAEPARMILYYNNVQFEDIQISPTDYPNVKSSYPNGQVPLLQIGEKNLTQSMAIFRYLANKFNLNGRSEMETAMIDARSEFFRELVVKTTLWMKVAAGVLQGDKDQLRTDTFLPAIQEYGPKLEGVLDKVGSGWFAPSGVTWVDFYIAGIIKSYMNLDMATMDNYKKLMKHSERVFKLKKLRKYVEKNPPDGI